MPISKKMKLKMTLSNKFAAKYTSYYVDTICPADNVTAGSLGRRRAGQLRFGFVAVSAGHIVCTGMFQLALGEPHLRYKRPERCLYNSPCV
jgi:hypothetical protein